MPNLLSKLLSGRRTVDPRSVSGTVFFSESEPHSKAKAGVFLEQRPLELGGLLGELLGAKDKNVHQNADDQGLPWWLVESVKAYDVLDELVPLARKNLELEPDKKFSKEELQLKIKKAVKRAVEELNKSRAASKVSSSGRHILEAGKELHLLLEGMGPLDTLFNDTNVTDILVDSWNCVRCIRRGQALDTPFRFRSSQELRAFVETLLSRADISFATGIEKTEFVLKEPLTSRITITNADDLDLSLVLRIPRLIAPTMYDLLKNQMLPAPIAAWLSNVVSLGEYPVLVVGPPGSGKTTLLSALGSAVGSDERVTLLDSGELVFQHGHSDRISINIHTLEEARDALHQVIHAPSKRLIVGELNSPLSGDLLGAVETKGFGSLSAMTAPSAFVALSILTDKFAKYTGANRSTAYARVSKLIRIIITLDCIEGKPTLVDLSLVKHGFTEWPDVEQMVSYAGEIQSKKRWHLHPLHNMLLTELEERGAELMTSATLILKTEEEVIHE